MLLVNRNRIFREKLISLGTLARHCTRTKPRSCDSFCVLDDISGEMRVRAKMMNAAIRQRQRKVTALEFVALRFDFSLSFFASGKVCAVINHVFLTVSVSWKRKNRYRVLSLDVFPAWFPVRRIAVMTLNVTGITTRSRIYARISVRMNFQEYYMLHRGIDKSIIFTQF